MRNILVVDLMTRNPITIKPDTNLFECAKIMVRKRIHTLIIANNKKLVGFITERDILWAIIKKSQHELKKINAIDISPKKIAVVKPKSTIRQAIEKMKKTKFDKFPVVHENELVGLITSKDILNFHPEFYPEFGEFSKIREEARKLKQFQKAEKDIEGICEECGSTGFLYENNGMLMCENCLR